jgi:hypothetical protein
MAEPFELGIETQQQIRRSRQHGLVVFLAIICLVVGSVIVGVALLLLG